MAIALSALIEVLSRPEAYPHPVADVEVHQTHISVVFLAGPYAYKVKKPVDLGFLDFSTLEKRKHFCEEEVRLNRRLAPQVYLQVVPITEPEPPGTEKVPAELRLGGAGKVVEWAVQMKRLPADATLESRLERNEVKESQIRALAARLAAFHRSARRDPRIAAFGRFGVVAQNARENFTQAEPLVGATVSPIVFERLRALTDAHLARHHDLIEARALRNVPRDTHGDLHLDHVYLFPEEPPPNDLVIIDCIEFADRFRHADPVSDMAFLAMDLKFHGRPDLARIFSQTYFRAAGDRAGAALLLFYCAYRAAIRAKVEGMALSEQEIGTAERQGAAERARAHWLLALGELEEPLKRPALVLIAGLPGSGKSTLAQALAPDTNFEVLRSDVVRKELTASCQGENIYADAWTQRTYAELLARAERLFWQGRRVLIDANFHDDGMRRRFLDAARQWAIPAFFVHCQADPTVIQQRLATRRDDASDADWRVYQLLESSWQPISAQVFPLAIDLDTSDGLEASLTTLRDCLRTAGFLG